MKRLSSIIILFVLAVSAVMAQTPAEWAKLEKSVNFYVANDLGRNGYYDQKPIAELMGRMAETVGIPATYTTSRECAARKTRSG